MLTNQKIVLTGANSGIGFEILKLLAAEKTNLIFAVDLHLFKGGYHRLVLEHSFPLYHIHHLQCLMIFFAFLSLLIEVFFLFQIDLSSQLALH